jgi:hypothetical protein
MFVHAHMHDMAAACYISAMMPHAVSPALPPPKQLPSINHLWVEVQDG